jgi:hypothetical protein
MTPAERKAAARLLNDAADEFSNNICNDFYLENTPENRELVQKMQTDEHMDEDLNFSEGKILTYDWILMRYLARKLESEE